MRTIRRTARFKRDYKREAKGRHRAALDQELRAILELLAADAPLPARYHDHPLTGNGGITGTATSGRISS